MSDFVLDCSVAVSWHFEDESVPAIEDILDRLPNASVLVPGVFHLEVLNVLLFGERHNRTTPAKIDEFISQLSEFTIISEGVITPEVAHAVLNLARKHHLTAYDAAYLELALRHALPLATSDRPLGEAALKEGIALLNLTK